MYVAFNNISPCAICPLDPQQKNAIRHKFRSAMAHDIGYAMLCVFSYLAAAKNSETISRKEMEARMAGRKREFMSS